MLSFGSFLSYCHKPSGVYGLLSVYSTKLYVAITTSTYLALIIHTLFISAIHFLNGVPFLNITALFLTSRRFAASSTPSSVIIIVPLTSSYVSL